MTNVTNLLILAVAHNSIFYRHFVTSVTLQVFLSSVSYIYFPMGIWVYFVRGS